MVDFGWGRCVESESERCPAGIVEEFEKFKMASKMAAMSSSILKIVKISLFLCQYFSVIYQTGGFLGQGIHFY